MDDRDLGSGHLQSRPDLHHAPRISCGHNLSPGIQNSLNFVSADPSAQLRVGDAVDSGPATTFVMSLQRNPFKVGNGIQKNCGFLGDPLGVEKMAGRIVGHLQGEGPTPS